LRPGQRETDIGRTGDQLGKKLCGGTVQRSRRLIAPTMGGCFGVRWTERFSRHARRETCRGPAAHVCRTGDGMGLRVFRTNALLSARTPISSNPPVPRPRGKVLGGGTFAALHKPIPHSRPSGRPRAGQVRARWWDVGTPGGPRAGIFAASRRAAGRDPWLGRNGPSPNPAVFPLGGGVRLGRGAGSAQGATSVPQRSICMKCAFFLPVWGQPRRTSRREPACPRHRGGWTVGRRDGTGRAGCFRSCACKAGAPWNSGCLQRRGR